MQKKSSSLSLYFKYPFLTPEFSILPFSTQLEEKYTLKSKAKKKKNQWASGNCRRLSNDVTIFPSSSTKRLLKILRGTLLCYLRLDQLADFSFTSPTTWNSTFVLTLSWIGVKFWYQRRHTEWISHATTTWNFVVSLTTGESEFDSRQEWIFFFFYAAFVSAVEYTLSPIKWHWPTFRPG